MSEEYVSYFSEGTIIEENTCFQPEEDTEHDGIKNSPQMMQVNVMSEDKIHKRVESFCTDQKRVFSDVNHYNRSLQRHQKCSSLVEQALVNTFL